MLKAVYVGQVEKSGQWRKCIWSWFKKNQTNKNTLNNPSMWLINVLNLYSFLWVLWLEKHTAFDLYIIASPNLPAGVIRQIQCIVFKAWPLAVCTDWAKVHPNYFYLCWYLYIPFIFFRLESLTQKQNKWFAGPRTTAGHQSLCLSPDQMESQRMMVRTHMRVHVHAQRDKC